MDFGTRLNDVNISKQSALNSLAKLIDQCDFKLMESNTIERYITKLTY